ncbi:uncharacterized protein LOC125940825 [Dermacentor silvarum]|uniref:uncharacterized protein LOC125940825 n=1 Tax=Dermacentor silvarum TaxID=543639 RepID=UPI002101CDB9|nr:uncharacterized protein LOC125940825 [Dermacentor silvarum]
MSLDVFFSAKTHKEGIPFRVIISEQGTWQKQVASYLNDMLKRLEIKDPFLVKNSNEVIEFLKAHADVGLKAFSVDVTDLYYSLPHDDLLRCVEECIDEYGSVKFSCEAGISVDNFLEMLNFYLCSTFIQWNSIPLLQKKGVCIGSCLAPVLSDLFLAKIDHGLSHRLDFFSKCVQIFRYVDDFIVFLDCSFEQLQKESDDIVSAIRNCLSPLVVTVEMPANGTIRFLDVKLVFTDHRTCWCYAPRANKALLAFHSNHSKLIKRSITKMCLNNALDKSCCHLVPSSFNEQVSRLLKSGYPTDVLVSVAEGVLRRKKTSIGSSNADARPPFQKRNVAVIPHIHQVSHNLKKLAARDNVQVVFSAPSKLALQATVTTNSTTMTSPVASSQLIVYPQRTPKSFHGDAFEDVEDRAAEFHTKATTIEKALQQRAHDYNRDVSSAPADLLSAGPGSNTYALRKLVRSIVKEELRKLQPPQATPTVSTLAAVIRDEVRHGILQPGFEAPPVHLKQAPPPPVTASRLRAVDPF